MSRLFSLQDKRALVTGGSPGIGLEIRRRLVSAGFEGCCAPAVVPQVVRRAQRIVLPHSARVERHRHDRTSQPRP
jgi:NAD(P)-dependent dehydrogenase (short-subunit alcohol dehydrogenase family)